MSVVCLCLIFDNSYCFIIKNGLVGQKLMADHFPSEVGQDGGGEPDDWG